MLIGSDGGIFVQLHWKRVKVTYTVSSRFGSEISGTERTSKSLSELTILMSFMLSGFQGKLLLAPGRLIIIIIEYIGMNY